ncbi:serine/threonine protein kinase [Pyxidicoccus fallax]|uniref:Serine/threonine protein kinase n=1 Tax=Pyxidicoccus fallax TaxID=394095 RepID=A0A848LFI4_9BACT|nr:serine/threonine-protein kinase [Pyxidicoccus fallax]NMO15803.1 serine/threonine protein kinase [Pyxidicoccus fallax]NPC84433.1 serine/threonine protein kinase [Pyxidicoccus fallax]
MACKHCAVEHAAGSACPAVSLEGQRHGPLVLKRRLGAGALGTVYLAEHPPTGHRFAVKVLHPHLAARPEMRTRFYREARALRELTHRHVARALDARPGPGGLPCLLMEYANGEPFSRLPMPLAPVEAVELLVQALEAVEAAHARGLVHCDLSADNLVLTRDARGERRVKVLDFGASAVLSASLSEEERACGMVVGSPAFIAPEQWAGEAVDGRADLYALGVVGYLLVTGRLPFGFGRVGELAPPEPHALNPSVPGALSAVLLRALAQRPEERFPDARAFREALAGCLGAAARPAPRPAPVEEQELEDIEIVVDDLVRDAPVARPVDAAPVTGVPWDILPHPIPLTPSMMARPIPLVPGVNVSIFGGVVPEDGATPLHLALREASLGLPPAPVVEVSAPCVPAPPGLAVRVGLPVSQELVAVKAGDVTTDGFFAAWNGVLPPLAARLPAELSFAGRTVTCECDVVRLVTQDEARLWNVDAGVFVQYAEPGEPLRQLLAQALAGERPRGAEPRPDGELARLLSRAAAVASDPYALLGARPDVDFDEVRRRAIAALRRLEAFRQRTLPAEQRRALESLRQRVEAARRTLGEPLNRAGFDAIRGNLAGLSCCVRAGLSDEAVEPMRRAFLAARPAAEARARTLFTQGHALEVQRALRDALSRYAEALSLDPLNVSWLRHYDDLRQKAHGVAPAASTLSSGAMP